MTVTDPKLMAEAIRRACFEAAAQAAEDAGISGLCAEGRLEAALDAIRSLPLDPFLRDPAPVEAEESAGSAAPARE